MTRNEQPAPGGHREAGSDHYTQPKNSTVALIGDAAARRYDRLRTLLIAVAEWDFHRGRHDHARYWLRHLREQRQGRRV